jgi:hypothetical protein
MKLSGKAVALPVKAIPSIVGTGENYSVSVQILQKANLGKVFNQNKKTSH